MSKLINRVVQLSIQLKAARDESARYADIARKLEEDIASLMRGEESSEHAQAGREATTRTSGATLASVVIAVLDEDPSAVMTVDEIHGAMCQRGQEWELASLRSTLARLAKNGRVARVTNGRYRSARSSSNGPQVNGVADDELDDEPVREVATPH